MKQRNMTIRFKDNRDQIYIDGDVTVAMDPLGFYVIRTDTRVFGFNSDTVSEYEYEYEEQTGPRELGDNVFSLQ